MINKKANGKLLIFEGTDKAGKTTMISRLLKLGAIDYYVKFSAPQDHGGAGPLYNEYGAHLAIVHGLQAMRKTDRLQVFDRFYPSEIAYGRVLRNNQIDWNYINRLKEMLLGKVDYLIVLVECSYEAFKQRGGDELTEEQFYAIRQELRLAVEGLNVVLINNNNYEDGWFKLKEALGNSYKGLETKY